MRYSGLALKFIYKNFLFLIILTVVSAIALSFYYADSSFSVFLKTIFTELNPRDMFDFSIYYYFSLISNQNWYYAVGALILICLTVTLVFGYAYRTMKVGGKSLSMPFKKINQTIIPVVLVLFSLLVILQLFALFATVFVNLLLASNNPLLYRPLIPLVLIVLYGLFFLIFLYLLMCVPTMLVTGYKFKEAIAYSVKHTNGRLFRFAFACLIPLIATMLIKMGLNYLTDALWLRVVSGTIITSFLLMYFPSLTMTAYYDIEGINRNDIKRRPIYF